jgi:DNA-binding LacI/PurR family transcriptional regulator
MIRNRIYGYQKYIMKKVTIRDVAERAGVGLGTVSRVLNHSEQVSEDTRQRVLSAMEALGYKPSAIARQLARKSRPRNIGVVTRPFLKNYYSFAERLRGVQKALQEFDYGYELMLFSTRTMEEYEERLNTIIQTGLIDGLLLIDLILTKEQQMVLETSGIPFVSLTHAYERHAHYFGTNNVRGGLLATEYLINLGHTDIAYVGDVLRDEDGFTTGAERFQGYQTAMMKHGLSVNDVYTLLIEHGYEQAYEATRELLTHHTPPTALFAMSDTQALGCIAGIRDVGLRVPRDISVIGYDDLEMSYHVGLTSVRQHLEQSGAIASTYLLQLMTGEAPPTPPRLPPLMIIERATTRPLLQDDIAPQT